MPEAVQALVMRAGIVVKVAPEDRRRLEAIVGDRNAPQKHVWRAKIIFGDSPSSGPPIPAVSSPLSNTGNKR
jgi:hypothetical protein